VLYSSIWRVQREIQINMFIFHSHYISKFMYPLNIISIILGNLSSWTNRLRRYNDSYTINIHFSFPFHNSKLMCSQFVVILHNDHILSLLKFYSFYYHLHSFKGRKRRHICTTAASSMSYPRNGIYHLLLHAFINGYT
jgi:hypothetical protein